MQKPAWKERAFEGRSVRMEALTGEERLATERGTTFPVFARVEIVSGMFRGAVYDKVPIYSPPLKAQLLERGCVEGVLRQGSALEGAPSQWVVK